MKEIIVKDKVINITGIREDDFVSLTDIARFKTDGDTNDVIVSWLKKWIHLHIYLYGNQ